MNETLLLDALLQVVTGIFYAYVGRVCARRRIGGDAQLAASMFSVWWYALGALSGSAALTRVLAYAGVRELGVFVTLTHIAILGLCLAFWALQYYLVYLFSGERRWLLPLSGFYLALYIWIVYLIVWETPIGVDVSAWAVKLTFERPLTTGPVVAALTLLLIVPPVLGGIGYARLFFRVTEPTARYRIGLISFTIVAWFGSSLAAWGMGINTASWWQGVSRAIGLVAALMIVAAYRPPAWVRRRWQIQAAEEAASAA
ncbi:MAG TPA: hypothetical protein VM370_00930 [Candidatus Thermoplasmatota archaeon]|nr:hypothetical protein [Candidatus Thermoplasmatota archaeon]